MYVRAHMSDCCVRSGTSKLWPMGQMLPMLVNKLLGHRHIASFT